MIIDVSSNQGHIDFTLVAPQVDSVFIRTSLGYGDMDKNAQYYAPHAKNAGLPVSYYHFAYLHSDQEPVADATKQANWFLQCVATLPDYQELVIDLEEFNAQGEDTTFSHDDYALWLQTFLDVVEQATSKKMIIYSYADYLNRHLPVGHTFGNYRLWLASYTNAPEPALPNGWLDTFMWQYSAKGAIMGITGFVDLTKITN